MREVIKALESVWRHTIVYPGLRAFLKNPELERRIDIQSIQSVLILRNDRIGDMIVTTPIFRALKKANPKLTIGVFASKKNVEIIRHNPNIDIIYTVHDSWIGRAREVLRARREKFDVVLDFIFNRMTSSGLLANIIAPKGIKIGQGIVKYKFYFNRLLSLKRYERHMAELLYSFVHEVFGGFGRTKDLDFEIFTDTCAESEVDRFLRTNRLRRRKGSGERRSPYLVLNLSAPEISRMLSEDQARAIGMALGSQQSFRTVIITAPSDDAMNLQTAYLCREKNCIRFPKDGHAPLLQIASLIEGAFCVMTPHTSIVHFASAMKTPVMGIYDGVAQTREWMPFGVHYRIVKSPASRPVSSIPIPRLLSSLHEFLKECRP